MFALGGIGRIDGFHTAVETENEEVQVETKAQAVRHSNLFIEFIKLKHTAGLVGIAADGPDVAGVHKDSSLKFPEQLAAVFHTGIQFDVTRLVEQVLRSRETTRSQVTDRRPRTLLAPPEKYCFSKGMVLALP